MERVNKFVCTVVVASIFSILISSSAFSATLQNMNKKQNKTDFLEMPVETNNTQKQREAELSKREKAVEDKEKALENREKARREDELSKKEQALNAKEKELKAKADKLSNEERKRQEAALKRKRAELKRQHDALKKSAEDAKKSAEVAKKGEADAKKALENLKQEQANTAERQAEKDKRSLIYTSVGCGIALIIIISLLVIFIKRHKRAKELEEELLLTESRIEAYKAEQEAQKKNAGATQRIPNQGGGKHAISFVVIKNGMAANQLSANFDIGLVIGRAPDCGLRLDNEPTVSGHHCEVRTDGMAYYIRDLGSTNGTALNGVNITNSTKINNGDKLLLGTLELVVSGLPQNAPSMTSNVGGATIRQRV
ncbi:MAG: FHA domain-containing protein [Synergistaceae bacterium]|nr:FHA domain-containing protein [Synergistaceae bacterium]